MKMKLSVANVTPVGAPDRAEHDMLGMIFGIFLANSGRFCSRGAIL